MIDRPKCLNGNQTLLKCIGHMTLELYLLYSIWGIKAIWGNWDQIPHFMD